MVIRKKATVTMLCDSSVSFITKMATWVVFVFVSLNAASAQDIRVEARIDSSEYLVGDWIIVTLKADHSPGISVVWPTIEDTVASLEVVKREDPTIQEAGGRVLEQASLSLAVFDSGTHVIPAFIFRYSVRGDTATHSASTIPAVVRAFSVIIDTTQDIKDIKPPLPMPLSFAEILPYLIGIALLGGLVWLVVFFIRRRRRTGSILPKAPPRPADEVALEALRMLDAERLWQRGKTKEYYSCLTDILRTYIDRRFDVTAMEMTTQEILTSPAISTLDVQTRDVLSEILVLADLVKFAKSQPLVEENTANMSRAISFVESTRTKPEILAEQAVSEAAA